MVLDKMTDKEAASYLKYGITSRLNGENKHNLDYLCKQAIKNNTCTLNGLTILNRMVERNGDSLLHLKNKMILLMKKKKNSE